MPGLTVSEKEHWKERIAKRLEKKIESISAADPNLFERIERQARQRALESLGLAALQAQLDEVKEQQTALENREQDLERAMLAKVRGVDVEKVNVHSLSWEKQEVDKAITRRQSIHEDELLADTEVGRQVLRLREEKANLIDTVWLATSPKQVRDLWIKVGELLGDQQTTLLQEALTIEPPAAE